MKDDIQKVWLLIAYVIVWALLIGLSSLLFSGCSVDKKAQKKVSWLLAHDKMDDACSRLYPNMDSISKGDSVVVFDTLYKEGPEVILNDTVYQVGDTVVKVITKQCPPERTIYKITYIHDTLYRSNTADLERLKGELLAKDGQIKAKDDIIIKQQQKIDKEDKWKVWFIILASLNVLAFVVRFFVIKRPI
jgi:hypothetical protein